MSRFVFVTWDGAGNLVPTLGIANRLARSGHDVRVLGHRSIEQRYGRPEWRFRAFERTVDIDSTLPSGAAADMSVIARDLWFSAAMADDVCSECDREAADVLVGDCMLPGALSAGAAMGVPTVALFHGAFALFRRGPLADLLAAFVPMLNALHDRLGLPAVGALADLHDRCESSIVAAPREFEPEMPLPGNVRFVGPILDAPRLMNRIDPVVLPAGDEPLVIVSFSTGHQGQLPTLQRYINALASVPAHVIVTTGPSVDPEALQAAGNVQVVRYVPHERLFPHASLVVTHAGLGTVMTALAHGVPLLCVPLGRDQFFNAARVEALGAGRSLGRDAEPAVIAAVVRTLLGDGAARQAACDFARVIAGYGNGANVVAELTTLANDAAQV